MDFEPDVGAKRPLPVRPLDEQAAHPHDYTGPGPAQAGAGHWWVWLVVLCVLGIIVYFLYPYVREHLGKAAGPTTAPSQRAIPVVTAAVRKGDMNLYLNGLGSVTPLNTVIVRSRVDGQIVKISFEEGQMVRQGDPLIEIDPRPFEVQLELAEGQMARDQAQLENAKRDLERYKTAGTAVTEQQMSTQAATVAQLAGSLKSDQAQIDNAKLQITYCHITAPLSGRIGLRAVDQGNIIHANDQTGLAVITQEQPIAVIFSLPEDDIPRVMKRMRAGPALPVEVYDRELKEKIAAGQLTAIDSQIDPTTGTVRFKATFANEDHALFPSQFVNVRLLVETRKDALIVPAAAIQRSPQTTFVYVVKPDQTVEMRDVEVGPTEGDQTVVEKGVRPGEIVVTDGVDKLQPGTKVNLGRGGPGRGGSTRPSGATGPTTGPGAESAPRQGGRRRGGQ
jgi:multidrug efflux system membrane fusion protein